MSITITSKTQATAAVAVTSRETRARSSDGEDAGTSLPTDKVSLGAPPDTSGTYGDPRPKQVRSAADIDALIAESDSKAKEIMDLILPMLEQQGLSIGKVVSGEQKLSADPATIDKAKAAVADGGEFSVEKVAERILNFARGAANGDPDKLAKVRAAVEDGFKQAADMFGGKLPEISEKTRSAIMDTFDRWQSEGVDSGAITIGGAKSVADNSKT